jgi:hypothetical protein
MATVRLGRYEAEDGDLPRICIRCGAPADTFKPKRFNWLPPWVYVLILFPLPFLIVALIVTKRMRVRAPLCEAHIYHWTWRSLFTLGGLAILVVFSIAAIVLETNLERQARFQHLSGLACVSVVVCGLAWLVAAAIIQSTAVRPSEITDRTITLTGVSREFAEALRQRRRRRDDEDDADYRRPRRRPSYEDEDDEEDDWQRR